MTFVYVEDNKAILALFWIASEEQGMQDIFFFPVGGLLFIVL